MPLARAVRTAVIDIVRKYDWPGFDGRALRNRFVNAWHGCEGELAEAATNAVENERYWSAARSGTPTMPAYSRERPWA